MPAVAIDPNVQRLIDLIRQFEAAPTPEALREIERLARSVFPRVGALSAAGVAALRQAVATLIGILLSTAGLVVVGTAVGTLAFWWLFFQLLEAQMSRDRVGLAAGAIAWELTEMLRDLGIEYRQDCFDELRRALEDALREHQETDQTLSLLDAYFAAIEAYLRCVGSRLDLTDELFQRLWSLLTRIGRRRMLWILTLFWGMSHPEVAGAVEERLDDEGEESGDPEETLELVRRFGLEGVPFRGGFGYCELEEGLPEGDDLSPSDVDVRVNLNLDHFSNEELEERKATLEAWIEELEAVIAEDWAALEENESLPEPDRFKGRVLKNRITMNNRQAETLRRALQNAERECQFRELAGQGGGGD